MRSAGTWSLHPAGCRRGTRNCTGYRDVAAPDAGFGQPVGEDRSERRRPRRPTRPDVRRTVSSGPHSPRQSRTTSAAPAASGFRARVEKVSYPLLVRLHTLPRWLVALIPVALLLGGLTAPRPYSSVCLAALVLVMGWVAYLAWHHGDRLRRVFRVVALGLAVVALVLSLLP
ncbi:DUF6703 family protein [Actinopolymorpha sp. B11F2]|uniref:DUF6703 family protein n=1 Tax=Actinopolymorpha sp. B11F2 TaxID=3160862 RepID=UPI0032E40B4E